MHLTIPEVLRASAQSFPDAPAIIDGDRRVGYGQLAEEIDRAAAALIRLGINPATGSRCGRRTAWSGSSWPTASTAPGRRWSR